MPPKNARKSERAAFSAPLKDSESSSSSSSDEETSVSSLHPSHSTHHYKSPPFIPTSAAREQRSIDKDSKTHGNPSPSHSNTQRKRHHDTIIASAMDKSDSSSSLSPITLLILVFAVVTAVFALARSGSSSASSPSNFENLQAAFMSRGGIHATNHPEIFSVVSVKIAEHDAEDANPKHMLRFFLAGPDHSARSAMIDAITGLHADRKVSIDCTKVMMREGSERLAAQVYEAIRKNPQSIIVLQNVTMCGEQLLDLQQLLHEPKIHAPDLGAALDARGAILILNSDLGSTSIQEGMTEMQMRNVILAEISRVWEQKAIQSRLSSARLLGFPIVRQ